jgi:hypothetical protein
MYKYLIIAPTIPSPIFTPKQINKYCYKSATMKLTTFSIFFMLVASIAALPGNDASGLVLRQTDEECRSALTTARLTLIQLSARNWIVQRYDDHG